MKGRLSAAVLSIALLLAHPGAPAPTLAAAPRAQRLSAPSPADSPPSSPALDSLRQQLTSLLADPAVGAGTWGVSVRSLSTGSVLFESNAHRLLTPASTLKVITLAVAADQLGWDFAFDTHVALRGTVTDGTLDGDLVVIGSGDPSFDDWDGAASVVFRTWAEQLNALGISTVTGRVVGDDRAFDDDGFGAGWMWDDMQAAYSAPASGLQFNEGAAQIVVAPASTVGADATVEIVPPFAPLALRGSTTTDRAGTPATLTIAARPRSTEVRLGGTVPLDGGRQVRTVAVADPTQYSVRAVRNGLQSNGIAVRGPAVAIGDVAESWTSDVLPVVMTHRSPQLSSLADTLMKLSQNLYAETLLRTLGRVYMGTGTAEAGLATVREVLDGWGVPASEVVMRDGSGLSRYNLVTAAALSAVLAHVAARDWLLPPYAASLPVAGRAGTLAARMRGTSAEGNVHAKTGSFTNARSIAGFLQTADGEPLVFAIIANNYGVPSAQVDRVSDSVLVALSAFRRCPEAATAPCTP